MKNKFTRYMAVKLTDELVESMAYSDISGRLFVPTGQPTLFNDVKEVKVAIKRTQGYLRVINPNTARKTKYAVYKLDFSLLD